MSADFGGRLGVTVPEAGRLLGIGRDAAYRAAERGELPTIRVGRRLVVPVPRLLALVGATTSDSTSAGVTAPADALNLDTHGEPREHRSNGSPLRAV